MRSKIIPVVQHTMQVKDADTRMGHRKAKHLKDSPRSYMGDALRLPISRQLLSELVECVVEGSPVDSLIITLCQTLLEEYPTIRLHKSHLKRCPSCKTKDEDMEDHLWEGCATEDTYATVVREDGTTRGYLFDALPAEVGPPSVVQCTYCEARYLAPR